MNIYDLILLSTRSNLRTIYTNDIKVLIILIIQIIVALEYTVTNGKYTHTNTYR